MTSCECSGDFEASLLFLSVKENDITLIIICVGAMYGRTYKSGYINYLIYLM